MPDQGLNGMKILVNAVSLRAAGGRTVAFNFVRAAQATAPAHQFVVLAPSGRGYEALASRNVRIIQAPRLLSSSVLWPVQWVWLQWHIRRARPNVVFSMGNLPIRMIPYSQLVLFHWAYAIYPNGEAWRHMSLRDRFRRRIRLGLFRMLIEEDTVIAAQTPTAKSRLQQLYNLKRVHVVPNAVSLNEVDGDSSGSSQTGWKSHDGFRQILCLSRYYPHKNIESLCALAELFRARGDRVRILTTIEASQHRNAARLLDRAQRLRLDQHFKNIGSVGMSDVPHVYRSVDALILPTLLESFSGTYVESMHFGVPILTSDRDFARDVCGTAATYFDPLDVESMYEAVQELLGNASLREKRIREGQSIVSAMPGWNRVATMYLDLLGQLSGERP